MFTEDTPIVASPGTPAQFPVINAHSTGAAAPFTTNVFGVRASALGHPLFRRHSVVEFSRSGRAY
jgi:hypothetical protein